MGKQKTQWPKVKRLPGEFSIYRLAADAPLPASLAEQPMTFVSRTDEELSIVCRTDKAKQADLIPTQDVPQSPGWIAIKVLGPIDFSVIGLLAAMSEALAAADISLFALSTFDTDYVLVPGPSADHALTALQQAGFEAA